jgi:hypothetical protein
MFWKAGSIFLNYQVNSYLKFYKSFKDLNKIIKLFYYLKSMQFIGLKASMLNSNKDSLIL